MSAIKPWLMVAVIFLVGAVAGSALTIGLGSRFLHPPPPGGPEMRKMWMMRLTRHLDLTSDQQAKIEPIINASGLQLQALRRDEAERATKIFDETRRQLNALLTPTQQAEFAKMEKDMDRDRDRMTPDGRRPGPPMGGPNGPGRPGPGGPDFRDHPRHDFRGGMPPGDHDPDEGPRPPPPNPPPDPS